jgi:hypothetical protein
VKVTVVHVPKQASHQNSAITAAVKESSKGGKDKAAASSSSLSSSSSSGKTSGKTAAVYVALMDPFLRSPDAKGEDHTTLPSKLAKAPAAAVVYPVGNVRDWKVTAVTPLDPLHCVGLSSKDRATGATVTAAVHIADIAPDRLAATQPGQTVKAVVVDAGAGGSSVTKKGTCFCSMNDADIKAAGKASTSSSSSSLTVREGALLTAYVTDCGAKGT